MTGHPAKTEEFVQSPSCSSSGGPNSAAAPWPDSVFSQNGAIRFHRLPRGRRFRLLLLAIEFADKVLDSTGTCDGERRMAVRNALGDCG